MGYCTGFAFPPFIMKSTTSKFLVLAAATASASGFKTPFQGIADAAQSPFAGKHEKPLTVSARDDVRVSHRAEMAEAYLSIRACDSDADLNTTVTSPTTVKPSSGDDYDDYAFRSRRIRGGKNKHDDAEEDEDEKQCARSSISVFVHDLDLLSTLNTNLTSGTGAHARINYINWQLSEATKAAQKSELRRKALDAMLETGKDYAAAFGVSEFVPTEFEEMYSFEDVRHPDAYRGRYRIFDMDEDSVDLRVPDIEQCMEVRCKFTN